MVDGCTEAETAGAVSDADLGLRSDDVSKLGLQASQPAGSVFASSTPASGRPRFSYAGMLREWGPWLEKGEAPRGGWMGGCLRFVCTRLYTLCSHQLPPPQGFHHPPGSKETVQTA